MTWSNQQSNSLTLGPNTAGQSINLTDAGSITGKPEIDFVSPAGTSSIYQDVKGSFYLNSALYSAQLTLTNDPSTGKGNVQLNGDKVVIQVPNGVTTNGYGPVEFDLIADTNGNLIHPVSRGAQTGSTNSLGQLTIPHGLTTTPTAVNAIVMTSSTTIALVCQLVNMTTTTFTVTVFQVFPTPGLWAGHSISINWSATL